MRWVSLHGERKSRTIEKRRSSFFVFKLNFSRVCVICIRLSGFWIPKRIFFSSLCRVLFISLLMSHSITRNSITYSQPIAWCYHFLTSYIQFNFRYIATTTTFHLQFFSFVCRPSSPKCTIAHHHANAYTIQIALFSLILSRSARLFVRSSPSTIAFN